MSDGTSAPDPQAGTAAQPQAGTTPVASQPPQAGTTPVGQASTPQTVDSLPDWAQTLIKEVRGEAAGHRKKVQDFEAAQTKAEQEAAVKNGEWEKLATSRMTEIEQLKSDLAKRDRTALLAKVAAAHKLPDELAELLQGEDEAALTEHAKRLAKLVKPAGAPDTEAGSGNRSGATRPNPAAAKKPDPETPLIAADGTQKVAWPS